MPAIPPYRTRRERTEITRNSTVLMVAIIATSLFASANHDGNPSTTAWLAAIGGCCLAGLAIFVMVSVWRATTGRDSFDRDDLRPLEEACVQKIIDQQHPAATAVAVRPVVPAPYAGYVWASVNVEPEATTDPSARLVRVRQIKGWALSRSMAMRLAQQKYPVPKHTGQWEPLNVAKIIATDRNLVEVPPRHLS